MNVEIGITGIEHVPFGQVDGKAHAVAVRRLDHLDLEGLSIGSLEFARGWAPSPPGRPAV
jgi:hypothetical protein